MYGYNYKKEIICQKFCDKILAVYMIETNNILNRSHNQNYNSIYNAFYAYSVFFLLEFFSEPVLQHLEQVSTALSTNLSRIHDTLFTS